MAKQKPDLFDEETPASKSQDFAFLFEQSLNSAGKKLSVGDKFRGEVLSIGKEDSFVSTGTPKDALIPTADLMNEDKTLKFKIGDFIDVVVVKAHGDDVRVVLKGSKSAPADIESLEDAFDMELPVEGKVLEVVNGGYRVQVQGQLAFCPFSQIDSRPVTDTTAMVGKKFEFLITQFDSKKRNVVVSRRRLQDLHKAEAEGMWLENHAVGDVLSGVVTRTEQFGAFVDLGEGVEGLVHVSEIGYVRLKHASEGVNVGDPVQVKILKVEEEGTRLRISLSIKQAGGVGDPWMQVPVKYKVGTIVDGVVDKKENFGLFVVLEPGINGLLPRSKWRDATDSASYENKKKGEPIKVRVDEVRFEERRISLGLPTEAEDESWRAHQSQSTGFGALAAAFENAKLKK